MGNTSHRLNAGTALLFPWELTINICLCCADSDYLLLTAYATVVYRACQGSANALCMNDLDDALSLQVVLEVESMAAEGSGTPELDEVRAILGMAGFGEIKVDEPQKGSRVFHLYARRSDSALGST